jgi:hypothetical protein
VAWGTTILGIISTCLIPITMIFWARDIAYAPGLAWSSEIICNLRPCHLSWLEGKGKCAIFPKFAN